MSRQAKAKWNTAASKVKKTASDLEQMIVNATDRSPTSAALERRIKYCEDAFKQFEDSHVNYLEVS